MSSKEQISQDLTGALLASRPAAGSSPARAVRVLDFMEASWVSGPAKNLIEFAQRAAALQASLQADIAVATFQRSSPLEPNEFTNACRQAGLDVRVIRERFPFDPNVIRAVRELIEAHDPDIVQTHGVKSHFLMRLSGAYRKRRWIAFHHGYTWTDVKVRLYNQLDRWSLPSASKIVTVCRSFANNLENIGIRPEQITIHHNSVNAFRPASHENVAELRRSLQIPDGARILLTVGRLSREKGQTDLIEAIALLRKENEGPELRLVIVGEGPDIERLQDEARKSAAADWIIFTGHQADVTAYYTLADLMVLPSHTEGSPNALLEAMAAGLPIVATAVGGVPEIVTADREAVLVEKSSPVSLARAIARVLKDGELRTRISSTARSTAASYSPAAYCDFMLSLYGRCLGQSSEHSTQ